MEKGRKVRYANKRKFPLVDIEEHLQTAIQMMATSNVSVLAVKVGEDLVGILTVSDVMDALAKGKSPFDTKISTFMTKCDFHTKESTRNSCLQLDENEDVLSAIKIMSEADVHHLLVTGANAEPIGIVSSLEMIKLYAASAL